MKIQFDPGEEEALKEFTNQVIDATESAKETTDIHISFTSLDKVNIKANCSLATLYTSIALLLEQYTPNICGSDDYDLILLTIRNLIKHMELNKKE